MSKQIANQKEIAKNVEAVRALRGRKATITQKLGIVRSLPVHRVNLAALGLRGINKSNTLTLTPAIEGMLSKVMHMVTIEEAK